MKAYKENCTMAILALFTLSHSLGAKACTPSVTKLLRCVSPCHVKYGVTKLCLVVGRDCTKDFQNWKISCLLVSVHFCLFQLCMERMRRWSLAPDSPLFSILIALHLLIKINISLGSRGIALQQKRAWLLPELKAQCPKTMFCCFFFFENE